MEEKVKTIKNGRELLECCAHVLDRASNGDGGGNVAEYPVIVIMMGKKCQKYVSHIRNTLEDNWNNARFLRYLSVVKKDGDICCAVLAETETYEECRWQDTDGDFAESLNREIGAMLETKGNIFAKKTQIKLDYVLDATESEGEEYYRMFQETQTGFAVSELKTLYLMLDQRPTEGRAKSSDCLMRHIVHDMKAKEQGTVYLLSNYMKSGRLLGDDTIWENYRLIADIILLGGNKGDKTGLYNGMKTASYAIVSKPTDEIAYVSLETLLKKLYELTESKIPHEFNESKIREQLEMDSNNGLKYAGVIYDDKIEKALPSSEKFQYLPFSAPKGFDDAERKVRRLGAQAAKNTVDEATYHAVSAYIEMYYLEPVERFFANKDEMEACRKKIRDRLLERFCFSDFLFLQRRENRERIERLLSAEYIFSGSSEQDELASKLHKWAVHESRKMFHDKIKCVYQEEMKTLLDSSGELAQHYETCKHEIVRAWIGHKDQTVQQVYERLADEFVKSKSASATFSKVFLAGISKDKLLEGLWSVFLELVETCDEFRYNFEEELAFRMKDGKDFLKLKIQQELHNRLSGSIRLKNAIEMNFTMQVKSYYLINENADYAEMLKNADGFGTVYELFNLNRTDCIEQIDIYNIDKPELLQLVKGDTQL